MPQTAPPDDDWEELTDENADPLDELFQPESQHLPPPLPPRRVNLQEEEPRKEKRKKKRPVKRPTDDVEFPAASVFAVYVGLNAIALIARVVIAVRAQAPIGSLMCSVIATAIILVPMSLILALIGAVLLRTAIWLYHAVASLTGSDDVPEPRFFRAMGVAFVANGVAGGFGYLIVLTGGMILDTAARAGGNAPNLMPVFQIIALVVQWVVHAGVLAALLPTEYGRGLMVSLCNTAAGFSFGAIIGGMIYMMAAR